MDLLEIEKMLKVNSDNQKSAREKHEREMNQYKDERTELLRLKALNMQNVDMKKVSIAEETLIFMSGFNRFDSGVIHDAIDDISSGKDELREMYFGIKDYAHWRGQRSDHSYNYGPKHGSIVFRVGLRPESRVIGLNSEERNACLYYLNLLLKNPKFRENAKGA